MSSVEATADGTSAHIYLHKRMTRTKKKKKKKQDSKKPLNQDSEDSTGIFEVAPREQEEN